MSYQVTPTMHYLAHVGVCMKLQEDEIPVELRILDDSDALLVTVPIAAPDPGTAVNAGTGQLALAAASTGDPDASGTPDHALLVAYIDSTWTTLASLPCVSESPQSGECYVTPFTITVGTPVSIGALTFG
jgi:hypothetical protein